MDPLITRLNCKFAPMVKTLSKTVATLLCTLFISLSLQAQNDFDGKGRRHGMWEKKFQNGLTRYKGAFDHGVEVGTFVHYYPSGKVRVKTVFRGKTGVGFAEEYDEEERLIAKGLFVDRKRDSTWLYFNDIGQTIEVVNYKEGERNGESLILYGDGSVMETITYVNGIKEGPYRKNYDTGKPWTKGNYKAGKYDGVFEIYDYSGKIISKGTYVNGVKHGAWYFSDKATLDKKVMYKNGYEVKPKVEEAPK